MTQEHYNSFTLFPVARGCLAAMAQPGRRAVGNAGLLISGDGI